jgi:hypothetical protein
VKGSPCGGMRKQGVNGDVAPFGVAVERHQLRRGGGANGGRLNRAERGRGFC